MNAKELLQLYEKGERNFSGVKLQSAYLSEKCLLDVNLSGANLQGEEILPTRLVKTILINANLNSANLQWTILRRAKLINSNLQGANLKNSDLAGAKLINANLQGANLRNADLSKADLTGANLLEADLTEANLSETMLIGSNLTNANLTNVQRLEETIFAYTIMPDGSIASDPVRVIDTQELLRRYEYARYEAIEADFRKIILHRVDLSRVNLQLIDLRGAHLSYVNLRGATLRGKVSAQFVCCDMKNINLICSNPEYGNQPRLTYCDLRSAKMSGGMDFSDAALIGNNFQGAKGVSDGNGEDFAFICNTIWTDGEFITRPAWGLHEWRRVKQNQQPCE